MSPLTICLIIFVLMVIGFCTNKLSLATVSLLAMMALALTGCMSANDALSYFGNSNVIMIAGMCVVAAGFNRTQFCVNLANTISGFAKGSLHKLMFGYVLIGMLLSQFIQSPVVAFGIVAPMLVASAEKMGYKPSKVMFPLGVVTIVTCCTLPVGAGATTASELNGYITAYYDAIGEAPLHTVAFLDGMIARLPLLIICTLYCAFVATRLTPDEPVVKSTDVQSSASKAALKPFQEYAAIVIFFLDALALMFASTLHLANWEITVVGALAMVVCGVLTPREATNALPMSMLLLIVGALAMSGALSSTGAGALIGEQIGGMIAAVNYNTYIVGFIFFIIPFVLTQVMQNRGTMLIFHPIAIATCHAIGANPVGLMILIQAACLSAFMTPMATAAVPYIMDYGGYDQKSMLKQSWPLVIICSLVSVFWIMTIYPIF